MIYFFYKKEWTLRNVKTEERNPSAKKVIFRRWDNSFDWWVFLVVIFGAIMQGLIFIAVIQAFKMSRLAGLNIGITTAIWSI